MSITATIDEQVKAVTAIRERLDWFPREVMRYVARSRRSGWER